MLALLLNIKQKQIARILLPCRYTISLLSLFCILTNGNTGYVIKFPWRVSSRYVLLFFLISIEQGKYVDTNICIYMYQRLFSIHTFIVHAHSNAAEHFIWNALWLPYIIYEYRKTERHIHEMYIILISFWAFHSNRISLWPRIVWNREPSWWHVELLGIWTTWSVYGLFVCSYWCGW